MNLQIEDFCIRCGICITLYPELFEMDFAQDLVRIKMVDIPQSLAAQAKQSIQDCAVAAIRLRK
jgi:ferredoxin